MGWMMVFVCLFSSLTATAQSTGDYQSAGTGDWATLATWQRYNGTSWVTPTAGEGTPTNSSGAVTILNSHTVTVAASVFVDQVVVNSGGQITVSASQTLTIANGSGTDLSCSGTISNAGTIKTTGTLYF